jgi:superfamily II DNA or RNA helicase
MEYKQFIATKRIANIFRGKQISIDDVHPLLFPFQRDVVRWTVGKGRAAVFLDTGLGKTFIQLEWARLLGVNTLIVAPLSVARQTVREGKKIGISIQYARHQSEVNNQIVITNYEMVDNFDPGHFDAVVLDESSILKSFDGATRRKLIDMFGDTKYRLACTATPAPNDQAEIGNHSELLGNATVNEMRRQANENKTSRNARPGMAAEKSCNGCILQMDVILGNQPEDAFRPGI